MKHSDDELSRARALACEHCKAGRPMHPTEPGYHMWREGVYLRMCLCTAWQINAQFADDRMTTIIAEGGMLAEPRREVLEFAGLMEERLTANDHKSHWEGEDMGWLLERLKEEVQELQQEIDPGDLSNHEAICNECADVANFAMMIADNVR